MIDDYQRCNICNYCRATDGPRKNVSVRYDAASNQMICSTCANSIWPKEEKKEETTSIEVPSVVYETTEVKAPTLAKVTGVNDGPEQKDILHGPDEETKEEGDVPPADTGSCDKIPFAA